MGAYSIRKTQATGYGIAIGLHVLLAVAFIVAAPKSLLLREPPPGFDVELWRDPVVPAVRDKTEIRVASRGEPHTAIKADNAQIIRQHVPPAAASGTAQPGENGFGRWAVRPGKGGNLSDGLKHPRRCFGLDEPPEGRPDDCPEWALKGEPPVAIGDPDRDHWRKEIAAIDRRQWMRDKAKCNDANFGRSVTALNSHRGDAVRFRSGCRGDQDARDEVDFKNGQTVDTVNRPDYGS